MNRLRFLVLIMVLSAGTASRLHAQSKPMKLLIGSYTGADDSTGIRLYDVDFTKGEHRLVAGVDGIRNASYLALTADNTKLFAVSETGKGTGAVYHYSLNAGSGAINYTGKTSSGGDGPCYVETDKNGKYIFAANYGGGSLSASRVDANNASGDSGLQVIQQTGSSINKDNQNKSHVHATVLSPDGRYLFVTNLGTDQIFIFHVDSSKQEPLIPATPAFYKSKAGSGPRHLTFHPNGRYLYVVNELDGSVDAFAYHSGKIQWMQRVSLLPDGFNGTIEAADIHTSPDGNFLYASNRETQNEISIFKIDKGGKLSLVGRQSTLGKAPRNFAIDPSGNYLLAANMNSSEVVIFKRDSKTGLLTDSGQRIQVTQPACLKFVKSK